MDGRPICRDKFSPLSLTFEVALYKSIFTFDALRAARSLYSDFRAHDITQAESTGMFPAKPSRFLCWKL